MASQEVAMENTLAVSVCACVCLFAALNQYVIVLYICQVADNGV